MSATAPMLSSRPITLDLLEEMRTKWTPEATAMAFDSRLREIERAHKTNYVEVGLILCEAEDRKLWALIPKRDGVEIAFHSLEAWVKDTLPELSRSYAYAAKADIRRVRTIPAEDLKGISRANIGQLAKLSTSVQKDPAIIEAAKTKSEPEFVAHVNEKHPDQHLTPPTRLVLHPDADQRATMDEACEMAMKIEDLKSREEAWFCIALEYKQNHFETYKAVKGEK